MAGLKMPELNHVLIAGNLTKDPVIRKTSNGIPVANFCLASNHKYRDSQNHWAEDVCYVGVVAWSRLAESCMDKLRKGSAVMVDGELQSRTWHAEDGSARTVVEIKAHRIQFLNRQEHPEAHEEYEELPIAEFDYFDATIAAGFAVEEAREILFEEQRTNGQHTSIELKLKPKA